MVINLCDVGVRYRYEWVFRGINLRLGVNEPTAILGHNGSGKSTLLRVLSGFLSPTQGQVRFEHGASLLDANIVFRQVSYAAPYIELIEELTLTELVQFHTRLKPLLPDIGGYSALFDILQLPTHTQHKEVRFFSSGMKQRLKLLLAICSDTDILLLDEPTSNLDNAAIQWYYQLIAQYVTDKNRIVVIASNDERDYPFASQQIHITDYKQKR